MTAKFFLTYGDLKVHAPNVTTRSNESKDDTALHQSQGEPPIPVK